LPALRIEHDQPRFGDAAVGGTRDVLGDEPLEPCLQRKIERCHEHATAAQRSRQCALENPVDEVVGSSEARRRRCLNRKRLCFELRATLRG
jgi:hypothetical protein